VNRIRNASDFLLRFAKARGKYEKYYRPRIEAARTEYEGSKKKIYLEKDDLLEAQVRDYLIDDFLKALNWRLKSNLIPEAQIQSEESGNVRFLDYLGLCRENKPLLIVETKRPNSPLPELVEAPESTNVYPADRETISSIIAGILKQQLKGKESQQLHGEWNDWLKTLTDYVKSATEKSSFVPRRVVLTSGNWLIVFINPSDSFFQSGDQNPEYIFVYETRDAIEEKHKEIFGFLEHQIVLNEAPYLLVEEISFYVAPEELIQTLHGIRLKYSEDPDYYEASPRIKIMPILLLQIRNGSWLTVESRNYYPLPFNIEDLPSHLELINNVGLNLLNQINSFLSITLVPTTIEEFYNDLESFEILKGVTHKIIKESPEHDEYLIITGQNTHYFNLKPSVLNCSHHIWAQSKHRGVATPISIQSRSVKPRSFFVDGEDQHCSHVGVEAAKSCQITLENKDRCSPRSGGLYDPFCEIWSFETRLCCRTCIYENICTKASAFNLPCSLET
jgi:hypothetical protein